MRWPVYLADRSGGSAGAFGRPPHTAPGYCWGWSSRLLSLLALPPVAAHGPQSGPWSRGERDADMRPLRSRRGRTTQPLPPGSRQAETGVDPGSAPTSPGRQSPHRGASRPHGYERPPLALLLMRYRPHTARRVLDDLRQVRGGAAAGSTVSCMVSSFRFGGGWDLGPAGRSHASAGPLS